MRLQKGFLANTRSREAKQHPGSFSPVVNNASLFLTRSTETAATNPTSFFMSSYEVGDSTDLFRPLKQKPVWNCPFRDSSGAGSEPCTLPSLLPRSCKACYIASKKIPASPGDRSLGHEEGGWGTAVASNIPLAGKLHEVGVSKFICSKARL